MQLLRILMLLTFIVPSCLLAKYSWVSRFDAGETGWYGFKSPLSRLTISNTTEVKYFPDSGSLKVDFEYSGAGSYLGMGSSTAYSRFKTDWSRFSYGGFVIYMKGTSDFPVNLGLKTRNGSYSIDLAVHPYWVKYSIPWQSFKLLNTAFDAFALKVENFELRPGGNTTVGPTTLYIEEFGFEDNIIKLEKAEMLDISGVVEDSSGKGFNNGKVVLQSDIPIVFGNINLATVQLKKPGSFKISYPIRESFPYAVSNLESGEAASTNAVKKAPAFKPSFFIKADADGYKFSLDKIDISNRALLKKFIVKLDPAIRETVKIDIDPSKIIRKIDSRIYGGNLGIWMADEFARPELIEAIRDSGITVLRFPGGGISQRLYFTREKIPWYLDPNKPGFKKTLNIYDIDKFMALCKATGAEPMISVDIESHHPEMAAEIVKYCNIEKKYGVKYFEIGNEPEGYSGDAWPGRAWGGSKEDMALKYSLVGQYHLEYQDQMKAVDPGIIVLGPVSANMNYSDNTFPKFWATVGEKLDVMTFHTYPQDDIRTNKWGTNSLHISDELLFKKPMEWVNTMASMHKLEKEFSPGRHSLYALTEWNTSFAHPGPRQQQTVGAIWVAKNLCEMIKYGMDIANIWDIIGKGYYNLFPIEDGKLVIKPTAKIYKILSHNFQGEMIQVNSPISNLSVYASINNGALNLVAINTAPDAAYVGDLEIAGDMFMDNYNGFSLSEMNPYQEFKGTLKDKKGYLFQPYTVTLLRFTAKAGQKEKVKK